MLLKETKWPGDGENYITRDFIIWLVTKYLWKYQNKKDGRLVSVAARSKAKVCGRSPAEIVGFESHRGSMVICLL